MFNGEKTNLFWMGLVILGFASLVVFTVIWQNIVSYMTFLSYSSHDFSSYYVNWSYVPIVVGGIVFMLTGYYMMKSGVKKEQSNTPKPS